LGQETAPVQSVLLVEDGRGVRHRSEVVEVDEVRENLASELGR
jgi:hypothetical protein